MIDLVGSCDNIAMLVEIGLPCAHLHQRVFAISKVNNQEQIAHFAVALGLG